MYHSVFHIILLSTTALPLTLLRLVLIEFHPYFQPYLFAIASSYQISTYPYAILTLHDVLVCSPNLDCFGSVYILAFPRTTSVIVRSSEWFCVYAGFTSFKFCHFLLHSSPLARPPCIHRDHMNIHHNPRDTVCLHMLRYISINYNS